MEEKILKELELIRKEHNRLKEISYQDLKEIYNTCIVLEKRMDVIKGIHRKNTILSLQIISDLFCLSFIFFSTVSLRDFDFPKS